MRQLKILKSITNRESESLEKYLHDIGQEELISVEEEVELAQRIRGGDQQALERLTKANLRFVVSVAKQYQNQGLAVADQNFLFHAAQPHPIPRFPIPISAVKRFAPCSQCKAGAAASHGSMDTMIFSSEYQRWISCRIALPYPFD